jgi:hypothetical protein
VGLAVLKLCWVYQRKRRICLVMVIHSILVVLSVHAKGKSNLGPFALDKSFVLPIASPMLLEE